jgi:hypothetical protein
LRPDKINPTTLTTHDGTDIKTDDSSTPVYAPMSGFVKKVHPNQFDPTTGKGYGHYIMIVSKDGHRVVRLAHFELGTIPWEPGTPEHETAIAAGEFIGFADSSGGVKCTPPAPGVKCDPAHVHFEYLVCGEKKEPLRFIRGGPFVGRYEGRYESTLESGGVSGDLEFDVLVDNHVVVGTPDTGQGSITEAGAISFDAVNRPNPSGGSFTGAFVGGLLLPSQGGSWTGTATTRDFGSTRANGTWGVSRTYAP